MAAEMREWQWSKPYLILCEGKDDQMFFLRLVARLKLEGKFEVKFPVREGDTSGGVSKFGTYLLTQIETTRGIFSSAVKAVLVVADSDNDPTVAFSDVCKTLDDAKKIAVPKKVQEIARKAGSPDVVILLLPQEGKGNLETFCLEAAYRKFGTQEHIERLIANTAAKDWDIGCQSKAKIHAILATTCKPKPETSFANHWQTKPEYHIPIDDKSFDDLAKFLTDFEAFVTPT